MAKITEADIKDGELVTEGSYLKHRFSLLGADGAQEVDGLTKIALSDKTASASTIGGTGAEADKAFDGDESTRYCASSVNLPQWLQIDLGEVHDISAIYMFFEQVSNWTYKLETSLTGNDGEWTEFATANEKHLLTVTEKVETPVQARFVRLTITGTTESVRNGKAWASIWEMEIYGTPSVANFSIRPETAPEGETTPEGETAPEAGAEPPVVSE